MIAEIFKYRAYAIKQKPIEANHTGVLESLEPSILNEFGSIAIIKKTMNQINIPNKNVLNADGEGLESLNFLNSFFLLGFSRNFIYSSVGLCVLMDSAG